MAPGSVDLDSVSLLYQMPLYLLRDPPFDGDQARVGIMRVEGTGEVEAVERGGVDGFLEIHLEVDEVEEELEGPLVLSVAARCAEDHEWFVILQDE